jgi:cell fate regulator YaaT (PSP1 superfamily)
MLNTNRIYDRALKYHDPVLQQEYATRAEIHYALRISFWLMNQRIREGKLSVHLIDNKIKVKVQDIINLFVAR